MADALSWLQQMLGAEVPPSSADQAPSDTGPSVLQRLQDLMTAPQLQSHYDPNASLAQNALNPAAIQQAMDVAMSVGPGAISRDIKSGLPIITKDTDRIASPYIGMGTDAPLFDLSRLTERPDVPQTPIAREPLPAKGVPEWASSQVTDPARVEQYKQVLKLGREEAGDENALGWWNTFPLRDEYLGEFGAAAGDAEWRSGMNMWSATSPRAPFPQNIRQASYFANLLAEGKPLPELVKQYQKGDSGAFNWVPTESAPKGYSNMPLHIQNIRNLYDPATGLLGNNYPLSNPKPASMAQNLVGNWSMPTIDVRDLKAMGLTDKQGRPMQGVNPTGLYGYIEDTFHRPLADALSKELKMDIAPAQMQSSTWVGVPEYFQGFDRSGTLSAVGTLEDSIRRTAASLGMKPQEALRRGYLRKEFKLLGLGGGLGLNSLLDQGVDPDQGAVR